MIIDSVIYKVNIEATGASKSLESYDAIPWNDETRQCY